MENHLSLRKQRLAIAVISAPISVTKNVSGNVNALGYKERIRERKRQMRKMQELLQPKQAAEGQDFFSFAQAARLMGVTRQYVYKLVKESKLRASRISGKKSLIRRADIELMLKTKPYERIVPKDDFDMSEYYTAEEIAEKYKVNAKWV